MTKKHKVEKTIWVRECFNENCYATHGRFMVGGVHEVVETNWKVVDHEGFDVGGDVFETRADAKWHAEREDERVEKETGK